ncbi:hypothetical protein Bca101_017276 [Brassica carinata]
MNKASGSSSFELRPPEKQKKKKEDVVSDSAADRSGTTKSTAADGRSKIFIRIRTKNNEETADIFAAAAADISTATAVADVHESDDIETADVSIGERISDGGNGGQEGDEFGPKTWNLRPRKPPTKKRSIGGNSGGGQEGDEFGSLSSFSYLLAAKVYGWLGWEYRKLARVPPACPFKPTATKVGAETISEADYSDESGQYQEDAEALFSSERSTIADSVEMMRKFNACSS